MFPAALFLGALFLGALAVAAGAAAQPSEDQLPAAPPALPWTDTDARVEGDDIVVARLGRPDPRIGRWRPQRRSARRRGEERARVALHRFVDDALARVGATPREATAAHAVLRTRATVRGIRPLVDGAAVVVVSVPRDALREATRREGVPW